MKRAYRIAVLCGAAPLVLGALLFLLWIVTKWDGVISAGVATIYLCLALSAVGLVALGRYGWLAARAPEMPRGKFWGSLATALVLLLVNFPVTWGITGAIVAIDTRYTVRVSNDSAQPLEHVILFGGGASAAIFSIPPHGSAERSLWFQSAGELRFEATRNRTTLAEKIDDRVANGHGGRADVRVDADGHIAVEHPSKRR